MARITLGIGTSHAPQLSTPPEEWQQRTTADRRNKALAFRGEDYAFDELLAARGGGFEDQLGVDVYRERHARCRAAIDTLGSIIRESGVDVLVIVSSDHKETFGDELLAPFGIYWGDTVQHEPLTQEHLDAMAPGLAIAEAKNVPETSRTIPCHSALALHLIEQVQAAGFDPAASRQLPAGEYDDYGIPHGWGFILQQVLGGVSDIPIVPIFVNTFWYPNPPTAARSYQFGTALGEAIAAFPDDVKVGVVASGGLSHFVIDEELDRGVLDAFQTRNAEFLTSLPNDILRAGTSEVRNWIVTAAAANLAGLNAEVIDYVPAYRSEAGTGCGMGFVAWKEPAQ